MERWRSGGGKGSRGGGGRVYPGLGLRLNRAEFRRWPSGDINSSTSSQHRDPSTQTALTTASITAAKKSTRQSRHSESFPLPGPLKNGCFQLFSMSFCIAGIATNTPSTNNYKYCLFLGRLFRRYYAEIRFWDFARFFMSKVELIIIATFSYCCKKS